tara:strand:- start:10232 stop:10405 length:174 start_codon:yes stop_codon:yes gene_type:complete
MTHYDLKKDNCCGNDKHNEPSKLEKEKSNCCDGEKEKKPETDNANTKGGGCCGGKTK